MQVAASSASSAGSDSDIASSITVEVAPELVVISAPGYKTLGTHA